MKKLICLLVTMCAMILMCSVAGAGWCDEHEWTYVSLGRFYHVKMCESCGLSTDEFHMITSFWEWTDLGDRHSAVCKYCDEDMKQTYEHYTSCNAEDPSCCETCGKSGISSENIEVRHDFRAVNCGDYHDYECAGCGLWEGDRSSHSTTCDEDQTVCSGCNATGLTPGVNISIRHTMRTIDLGTQHQSVCNYCDFVYAPEDHIGQCDDPDYCLRCFKSGVTILPELLYCNYSYVNTGKQHVGICDGCDKQIVENHEVLCEDPHWCLICDLYVTEVELSCIMHWAEDTVYERTATKHTRICSLCDMHWEPLNHFRTCDENGVCAECRMTVNEGAIISKTVHRASYGTATYTAERHSFTCADCGQYVQNQPHFFWYIMYDNECDECGYVYGSLPPSAAIPGDPTGDGMIDIMDALAILQYDVGWDIDIDIEAGDVNDDGACDVMDALLILQYDVGWDVELK